MVCLYLWNRRACNSEAHLFHQQIFLSKNNKEKQFFVQLLIFFFLVTKKNVVHKHHTHYYVVSMRKYRLLHNSLVNNNIFSSEYNVSNTHIGKELNACSDETSPVLHGDYYHHVFLCSLLVMILHSGSRGNRERSNCHITERERACRTCTFSLKRTPRLNAINNA